MVILPILNLKLQNKTIACAKHYFLVLNCTALPPTPSFVTFFFHLYTLLTSAPAACRGCPTTSTLAGGDSLTQSVSLVCGNTHWTGASPFFLMKGKEYSGKSLKFDVWQVCVEFWFFHSTDIWLCNFLSILDSCSSYIKKRALMFTFKVIGGLWENVFHVHSPTSSRMDASHQRFSMCGS